MHGWHATGPEFSVHNCNKQYIPTITWEDAQSTNHQENVYQNHCGATSHQDGCLRRVLKLVQHHMVDQMTRSSSAAHGPSPSAHIHLCACHTPGLCWPHPFWSHWASSRPALVHLLSCQRFLQRKTKALLTTKQESRKGSCWTISSRREQLLGTEGAWSFTESTKQRHTRFLPHKWLEWGSKGTEPGCA